MSESEEGVMIALLPTTNDWCKIDVPHMTLVYAGKKKDLSPSVFNELGKDACSIASLSGPIGLRVTGVDVMGGEGEDKVNVLTLMPSPELWAMRRQLEKWNASEHPFKPHATIGPVEPFIQNNPGYLTFDRIAVGWGGEYLTFWLRRNGY